MWGRRGFVVCRDCFADRSLAVAAGIFSYRYDKALSIVQMSDYSLVRNCSFPRSKLLPFLYQSKGTLLQPLVLDNTA